jgi:hypothetical protein
MLRNKPVTSLIAAGLIMLLIAIAGVYPLISRSLRLGGPDGLGGGFSNRGNQDFRTGNLPSGVNRPQGSQPGNGQFNDGQSGNFNFPQNGSDRNFTGSMPTFSTKTMKVMQLLQIVQTVGGYVVILFGVLSVLGIMLAKNWGRKLAIWTSILAILFTVAGMFGFMMGLSLWIKIAAIVLSIAIVVLSSLPKSRQPATVPA